METPAPTCALCPRLVAFRQENAAKFPDWHNAPVASFGDDDAALLIVGLAPGLKGASASARTKPALLETGFSVQVPEYIEPGERVKVNTTTGKFRSRA